MLLSLSLFLPLPLSLPSLCLALSLHRKLTPGSPEHKNYILLGRDTVPSGRHTTASAATAASNLKAKRTEPYGGMSQKHSLLRTSELAEWSNFATGSAAEGRQRHDVAL